MSSNYYGYGDYSDFGPVQTSTELVGIAQAILIGIIIIALLAGILMIVSMWKTFEKAGKPGWASLIPIYNTYVMCEIGGKEWWFILLTFVPVINILATFMIYDGIAKKFGKSTAFSLGMFFIPIIFFPILAFGKNYYEEENQVSNSSNYNNEVANIAPSSDSDLIMEDTSNISSGVSSNESLQVNNQNKSFDSFDNNFNLGNEQTNQVVGQVSSNMETQNEASNFVAPQISSEIANQNQANPVMQNSVNEPEIETPNEFINQSSINVEQQNSVNNLVTMQQMPNNFVNQNQGNTVMQNSINEPVIETPNEFTNQSPINMGQQNPVKNPVTMEQMPNGFANQNQGNTIVQNSVNGPVIETPNEFTNQSLVNLGQQNMVNNPVTMQQMPNGYVNQNQGNTIVQNGINQPVMQQKENAFEIHDDNNN